MKTTTSIYVQRQRLFSMMMRRGTRRAAAADPRTGGMHSLVHNWGNKEAAAAIADMWAAWSRISDASKKAYDLAEHARHGDSFRPLWCEHCKPHALRCA